MKTLAIIPARGGSKRIKKKNIKPFLGLPIISYPIKTALNSNLFDEVMVSTDCFEISKISKQFGASVPFMRSDKNASDFATIIDVILEVCNCYDKIEKKFDFICCIFPCTPLLKTNDLERAFNLLKKNKLDCVFPIVKYSFPIQRAVKINDRNLVEMFNPEHLITRSQDLTPSFHDIGQFYFLKTSAVFKEKMLVTNNTGYIEKTELESQDIDNEVDWKLAEIKYNRII